MGTRYIKKYILYLTGLMCFITPAYVMIFTGMTGGRVTRFVNHADDMKINRTLNNYTEEKINVHRAPTGEEIRKMLAESWPNKTVLTDARLREVPKFIKENPSKLILPVDYRVYLRTNENTTAAADMRNQISTNLTRCQAMQIIRSGIIDNATVFEFGNKTDAEYITKHNQSECMAVHDSCAIVGNSGILLDSKCGDVIDSADLIIRNNLADMGTRFQVDVGTRTDVMTVNHELVDALTLCTGARVRKSKFKPNNKNCKELLARVRIFKENSIMWFFKKCTFLDGVKKMVSSLHNKNKLDFRFAYSPVSPMDIAAQYANVSIPTSGLAVYLAATQFCRSISLFGFYPFIKADNVSIPFHYYDKTIPKTDPKNVHKMPVEYKLLSKLESQGVIRIINDCKPNRN